MGDIGLKTFPLIKESYGQLSRLPPWPNFVCTWIVVIYSNIQGHIGFTNYVNGALKSENEPKLFKKINFMAKLLEFSSTRVVISLQKCNSVRKGI